MVGKNPIPAPLRRKVFNRDDYQCRNCGSSSDLQAHHIVPSARGGNTNAGNCVTLCGECHASAHGRPDRALSEHSDLISEGIAARQESDEYRHGPAPLGFEKNDGALVEGDQYQRVVEILEQVARGEVSKRQASKELDTSRRTVQRSVEDRADLYGL